MRGNFEALAFKHRPTFLIYPSAAFHISHLEYTHTPETATSGEDITPGKCLLVVTLYLFYLSSYKMLDLIW